MPIPSQTASHRHQLVRWWGWLAVTTILSTVLIAARYFTVTDFDAAPATLLFRTVMLLAHFTVVSTVWLSPVLLLILIWPAPRLVLSAGVLSSAAIIIALLVDTQVYQLYRFHIDAGVLNLLFGGAARETFVFPTQMYLQTLAIFAAVMVVLSLIMRAAWKYVAHAKSGRRVATLIVSVLAASVVSFHAVHAWADVVGREPLLEQTDVLPLRYAATAKRLLRSLGINVPARAAVTRASGPDHNTLSYPLRPFTCKSDSERRNIIVILIDSWRFDQLDPNVTPNVAALADRSARFTNHYSGGNATRMGVFSLFYSIPGTYWHRVLAERHGPVVIDEVLRQGYAVRVFRSAPLYSPEFDRTVFAHVPAPRMRSDGDTPAQRDRDLTLDFATFLESRADSSPFFAVLFYDSPHSFDVPPDQPLPFQPSAAHVNYLSLRSSTDPRPLLNRYRNSIHYVDSLIGEVFDSLRKHEALEDAVIIVTGDHGQEFNDNRLNYWGHNSNYSRHQTGVPLVLFDARRGGAVMNHRTTHYDVMPTLMREYLGCDEPFETHSVGRPLFEPGGRDPMILSAYNEFAIMQTDRVAVVDKFGLQMRGTDYSRREGALDARAVAAALEQKSRFYR